MLLLLFSTSFSARTYCRDGCTINLKGHKMIKMIGKYAFQTFLQIVFSYSKPKWEPLTV